MSPEELRTCARRLVEEVLNQGDLAAANQLISPDCIHHGADDRLVPGLAGLQTLLLQAHSIFPDFHAIVEDEFAAGNQVAQRITAYGTHEGDFLGIPPTGRPVTFEIIQISRAGPDGKFTERWCGVDLLGALRQVGVLPARLARRPGWPAGDPARRVS
jgi:predicted ester cyclase